MTESYPRAIASLEQVFGLLDRFSSEESLDRSISFPLTMAVEELFTNMVKYNPDGLGDILIRCSASEASAEVSLVDTDSKPFDVTADRGVDVEAGLTERKPGGLGLHLIQRMMDEVYYQFKEGRTEIRLIKYR